MKIMKKNVLAIIKKAFEKMKRFIHHYNEISNVENDKFMKPTIQRAYYALQMQLLIVTSIYGICILFFSNSENYIVTFIGIIILICLLIFIFYCSKNWIQKALESNKILLATNIYIGANIYLIILTILGFKLLPGYSDYDRAYGLVICFYWILYFFNLIPGKFIIKILGYLLGVSILTLITNPPFTYGTYLYLGHFIGNFFQLYIMWEKYHEDSLILNTVEYEKNVSNFLQNKFPDPVFTLNSKLDIIKLNEKATMLLKESNKIFFKEYASEIQNEKGNNLNEEIFSKSEFENMTFTKKINEKNFIKFIVNCSRFQIEKKKIIIVILKDVTEIFKIHEQNLSEKYQNILLFSAPHEIRSQLNLISGNLEQLEKKFDPFLLKIAIYAAKVMEYKLNLIFDFVHITTNKFAEYIKQFHFKRFMEEVGDVIHHFAKIKALDFEIKYKTRNSILSCDIDRFISMIIHICLNAVKHTYKGKILMDIRFKSGFLHAKIQDSGIGMNQSIVCHLNQFSLEENTNNYGIIQQALKSYEEIKFLSGIGTVTSALICKKLGGSLSISSHKDIGTIVNLQIKCKENSHLIEGIEDETSNLDSERISNREILRPYNSNFTHILLSNSRPQEVIFNNSLTLKILVVDDQPFNRLTLVKMLQSLGYDNIYESENGKEAIAKAQELMPICNQLTIFMDIEMPIMNGIEATKTIKHFDKNNSVKIVMLSAFNDEEIIQTCYQVGAIEFYVKPISFKKLKEMKDAKVIIF